MLRADMPIGDGVEYPCLHCSLPLAPIRRAGKEQIPLPPRLSSHDKRPCGQSLAFRILQTARRQHLSRLHRRALVRYGRPPARVLPRGHALVVRQAAVVN